MFEEKVMSRAAALLRAGAAKKKTVEENPIWAKTDWEGNTMVEFKSDGLWGYKTMPGVPNDNSAMNAIKKRFGSKKEEPTKPAPKFRVCSFNVLAQCYVNQVRFPYVLNHALKWRYRRVQLMKEVLSYNADVLCLQECDNYREWWQGKMGMAGYDGVFLKKDGNFKDGLAIFYKRDLFQLFRTKEIHFNDIGGFLEGGNPERAQTDDVGLILGLQPWEDSPHPSAICVANVQLQSDRTLRAVQKAQSRKFMFECENFNAQFQAPMVICGSFNCTPSSEIYGIMCTGKVPERPQPPSKMKYAPIVSEPSRSTIKVEWEAPFEGDAPITGYKVKRRAGGNTAVGFTKEIDVPGEHIRHFIVCLLSSGTTYEFIVAAYSSVGVGEFSDPSLPISTNFNAANPPLHMHLKSKVKQDTLGRVRGTDDTDDANKKCPFDTHEADDYDSSDDDDVGWGYGHSTGAYGVGEMVAPSGQGLTNTTPRFDDGRANMRISPVRKRYATGTGRRHQAQIHCMCLASAYGKYKGGEEPRCTFIHEGHRETYDYIFFSHESLIPTRVLSVPTGTDLRDVDPRQPKKIDDPFDKKPPGWDDRKEIPVPGQDDGEMMENPDYKGEWKPRRVGNMNRWHSLLPNSTFSSDHFALMSELQYLPKYVSGNGWNSDVVLKSKSKGNEDQGGHK